MEQSKPLGAQQNHDDEHYVTLYGKWRIERWTPVDGQLQFAEAREGINVITTVGKQAIASFLVAAISGSTNTFKYVAVGTGQTAESASQTALTAEVARHTGTVSYVSSAIYQVTATFPTGTAAGTIYEYGLFNSNSVGTMLSRDLEALITVGASDVLIPTLQLTLS